MITTEPTSQQSDFLQHMQQLDGLLEQLTDPVLRERTAQIIQGILEFHAAGVGRMFELVAGFDRDLAEQLSCDEVVSAMLLLYNLHPQDMRSRVLAALESVRPYLGSHGGNIELLEISEDGNVHLQMQGSCHGCPSSSATLKNVIERAIYERAPDVAQIVISDLNPEKSEAFVPIEHLTKGNSHVWQTT